VIQRAGAGFMGAGGVQRLPELVRFQTHRTGLSRFARHLSRTWQWFTFIRYMT
jgi:hypothetical protein